MPGGLLATGRTRRSMAPSPRATPSTSVTTTRTASRMPARPPWSGITGWSTAMPAPASPFDRSRPPESLFTFRGSGVLIDAPGLCPGELRSLRRRCATRRALDRPRRRPRHDPRCCRCAHAARPHRRAATDGHDGRTERRAARLVHRGSAGHDPGRGLGLSLQRAGSCSRSWSSTGHPATRSGSWSATSRSSPAMPISTGFPRREERAVDDARTGAQVDFRALDLTVSDRYVLDEAVAAGTAPLTFALAGLVAAVAGSDPRRLGRRLPDLPAVRSRPAGAGDQPRRGRTDRTADHRGAAYTYWSRACPRGARGTHPLRARSPGHDLAPRGRRGPGPVGAGEPGDPAEAAHPDLEPPIATTLIVERTDTPQGIAVGSGELTRLSTGQVMTLRAP